MRSGRLQWKAREEIPDSEETAWGDEAVLLVVAEDFRAVHSAPVCVYNPLPQEGPLGSAL